MNQSAEDILYVQQHYHVSVQPAPESRLKFLKRFISRCVLHFINGQNAFNVHVARSIGALCGQLDQQRHELVQLLASQREELLRKCDALQRHYDALSDLVAKRFHESTVRQDAIVASLHATDERLDQLIARVDRVVDSLSSTDRALAAANARQDEIVQGLHDANLRADAMSKVLQSTVQRTDVLAASLEACAADVARIHQRHDDIVESVHRSDTRVDEVIQRQDALVASLEACAADIARIHQRHDDIVESVHRSDTRVDEVIQRQDALVASLEACAADIARIHQRHDDVVDSMHRTDRRIDEVTNRQDALVGLLHAADQRIDDLMRYYHAVVSFAERAQDDAARIEALHAELAALHERINAAMTRQDALLPQLDQYQQCADTVREMGGTVAALETRCQGIAAECAHLQSELEAVRGALHSVERELTSGKTVMQSWVSSADALARELRTMVEDHLGRAQGVYASLAKALAAAKQKRPVQQLSTITGALLAHAHVSGSAYEAYEAVQRGPEELVRERLRVYLPWLQRLPRTRQASIVDLGCGRGEFLDLASENGLKAYGVDINPHAVHHARAKGHTVSQMDLFEALREVKPHSLTAITAFHIIEHMPFPMLCHMIELARRALCAEGLLIMETPNVFNVQVAASDFYKDPSHVRPVHPVTLDTWLKQSGFSRVHIEFIHPFPANERLTCSRAVKPEALRRNMQRLNDLLYGYRDCTIIATADPLELKRSVTQP